MNRAATAVAALMLALGCGRGPQERADGPAPADAPAEAPTGGTARLDTLEQRLMAAAIDTIISGQRDSATVCIEVLADADGRRPDVRPLLERLRSRRDLATDEECPRTYASMIQPIDSLGRIIPDPRPEGYVDPYRLRLGRPRVERPGVARIDVRQLQGMGGWAIVCVAREGDRHVEARCRVVNRWVS